MARQISQPIAANHEHPVTNIVAPASQEQQDRNRSQEEKEEPEDEDDEDLYDPEKEMFLPDRFIKGDCPSCGAKNQNGDNCDVCSATYDPTEVINPRSVVSGATPILRDSEHYFFDLPKFESMLKGWIRSGAIQNEMANKLEEWFEKGLQQWDISRDAPYFGFEIPNAPGKFFYVWSLSYGKNDMTTFFKLIIKFSR